MTDQKSFIWDETFPALLIKGEGSCAFLQGQTTADVFAHKQSERIFTSCWLSTKGSLKALLEIRLAKNMAEILVIAGEINSIKDGFESVIFPADKVKLETIKPVRRIQKINNLKSWKIFDSSFVNNNNLIQKGILEDNKLTKTELEIWKIRQGIPSYEREINGATNPYELGLADTISLNKGCYLGQEAIARFFRSKCLKYQLRYWESYGESNNFEIGKNFLNANQEEVSKEKIGVITSSIRIKNNFFNGLALIRNKYLSKNSCFSEDGSSIILKKPISFAQND